MIIRLTFVAAVLFLMIGACSVDEPETQQSEPAEVVTAPPFVADKLLPESGGGTTRLSEPMAHTREDVHAVLGERATEYLSYNLVGLAAAEYEVMGTPVSAQLAQFESREDAFGLYKMLRPDDATEQDLGADGFLEGSSLYFTQNQYVVRLISAEETQAADDAMRLLGIMVSARLGEATEPPDQFGLFPEEGRISGTEQFYAESFLSIEGFDRVYTISYDVEGDTTILFLTDDPDGLKMVGLIERAKQVDKPTRTPGNLGFDENYGVTFPDDEYGTVLAGLKDGRLIGVLGYEPPADELVIREWLDSLAGK